jgi:hypothetical protein
MAEAPLLAHERAHEVLERSVHELGERQPVHDVLEPGQHLPRQVVREQEADRGGRHHHDDEADEGHRQAQQPIDGLERGHKDPQGDGDGGKIDEALEEVTPEPLHQLLHARHFIGRGGETWHLETRLKVRARRPM